MHAATTFSEMFFIKVFAGRCCDIVKAKYYTSTVQQSLVIKK